MSAARRVVVIGGGVGGLATAALLARGGALVTLLERHDSVGGRVGTASFDGFRFDTGPSWYFMPEVIEHTFALLGARIEDHLDLVPLDPVYRLFPEPDEPGARSEPFELSADPVVNTARFEAREPGAGAAIARYGARASDAYRVALDHFLYTTFQRPDRILTAELVRRGPELASLLTRTLAQQIEKTVDDPVLRQVLGYHAVFLGSSPYRVPALYSLMSHLDLNEGVRYPRGGMYTLVQALAELARREGVQVRTGADVVGIEVEHASASRRHPRRLGIARGVRLADGEVIPADIVVSNADRPVRRPAGPRLVAPRTGHRRAARHGRGPRRAARAGAPLAVLHPRLAGELRGDPRPRPDQPRGRSHGAVAGVVVRVATVGHRPGSCAAGGRGPVRPGAVPGRPVPRCGDARP